MFKNSYQSGLLSIFYSCGTNPLAIWDMEVHNGHIKRVTDKDVNSVVLELVGTNVTTTYIVCPKNNKSLGIRLPFLFMIVKDLKKYFTFEITIIDDKGMRRRFRISNFATATKIVPFCTTMPIGLSPGWNQIQFNLADFTRRAYGSTFMEVHKVQVHANTRLRRIYFSDRLYSEDELPQDYKLYLPVGMKSKKEKVKEEPAKPVPSKVESAAAPVPYAEMLPYEIAKSQPLQDQVELPSPKQVRSESAAESTREVISIVIEKAVDESEVASKGEGVKAVKSTAPEITEEAEATEKKVTEEVDEAKEDTVGAEEAPVKIPSEATTMAPPEVVPKTSSEALAKAPSETLEKVPSAMLAQEASATLIKAPSEAPTKVQSDVQMKASSEVLAKIPSDAPPEGPSEVLTEAKEEAIAEEAEE